MKEILEIECADNGMIIRGEEMLDVVEDTHNTDGVDKDNLQRYLGRYLLNEIKYVMDEEISNKAKVEINITSVGNGNEDVLP